LRFFLRATILRLTWAKEEKGEDGGCSGPLISTNRRAFDEIDAAMNAFVGLVLSQPINEPDLATVQTAFDAYLDRLKLGDLKPNAPKH
jgi:hypothetical protein